VRYRISAQQKAANIPRSLIIFCNIKSSDYPKQIFWQWQVTMKRKW